MSTTRRDADARENAAGSTSWPASSSALVIVGRAARLQLGEGDRARPQEKADQLIAALEDAGAPAPDQDQIVRVLGDDGGATCENPNDALQRAILLAQLTNGAAGPGDAAGDRGQPGRSGASC